MKNPLLSRVLGESDDVVPVIANVPRRTHRDRMRQPVEDRPETSDDSVRRMVGEGSEEKEEGIIPDEAEELDTTEITVGKPLKQPKEIVQEPSHPVADKEKYQTPYAALTAPDVTPQSTEPIDPSALPGAAGPERFTAADLERAPAAETAPEDGTDPAVRAMDVLLGRNRAPKPATQPGEFEAAGAIKTEEQANAALGIKSPVFEQAATKAASLLEGGGAMPPPTTGDGSQIYSAFRRFAG